MTREEIKGRIQRLEYHMFGYTQEDLEGIRKGVRDIKEGRVRPWTDIKKELFRAN
ncbi:hypothetical protein ES708_16547 [subsurface metagenome]